MTATLTAYEHMCAGQRRRWESLVARHEQGERSRQQAAFRRENPIFDPNMIVDLSEMSTAHIDACECGAVVVASYWERPPFTCCNCRAARVMRITAGRKPAAA